MEAEREGHSTPVQAAAIARKANVKYLALVHLPYARLGPQIEEEYLSSAKKIFANTFVPRPLDRLVVEDGKIWVDKFGYKD